MSPENPKREPSREADRIVIEVMSGPEDGRKITCNKAPITIGRAGENSVSLPSDHLISRRHATISRSEGGFSLKDLGSSNGTFVGKKQIRNKSARVKPDELFRVGATLLRIRPRRVGVSSS